jgi:hypothetical protein
VRSEKWKKRNGGCFESPNEPAMRNSEQFNKLLKERMQIQGSGEGLKGKVAVGRGEGANHK